MTCLCITDLPPCRPRPAVWPPRLPGRKSPSSEGPTAPRRPGGGGGCYGGGGGTCYGGGGGCSYYGGDDSSEGCYVGSGGSGGYNCSGGDSGGYNAAPLEGFCNQIRQFYFYSVFIKLLVYLKGMVLTLSIFNMNKIKHL